MSYFDRQLHNSKKKELRVTKKMVVLFVVFMLLIFLVFKAVALKNEAEYNKQCNQRAQKEREKLQVAKKAGEVQYKHFEDLYQEAKEKIEGRTLTQLKNIAYEILILEYFAARPNSQGASFFEIREGNPIFVYTYEGSDLFFDTTVDPKIREFLKGLERSCFIERKEVKRNGLEELFYLISDNEQCGYDKALQQVRKQNSQEVLAPQQLRIETYKALYYLYINDRRVRDKRQVKWSEGYLQSEEVQKRNIGITAVDKMDGHQFENCCAELLRKLGYYKVEVTKGSGDQGVDIVAVRNGISYAIQCKRYSSTLGNTPVQEVHAGKEIYKCHVGVVLTNQYFTLGAKELAKAMGVLLWDRGELQRMIAQAK